MSSENRLCQILISPPLSVASLQTSPPWLGEEIFSVEEIISFFSPLSKGRCPQDRGVETSHFNTFREEFGSRTYLLTRI
jgi:hypothetical protein